MIFGLACFGIGYITRLSIETESLAKIYREAKRIDDESKKKRSKSSVKEKGKLEEVKSIPTDDTSQSTPEQGIEKQPDEETKI